MKVIYDNKIISVAASEADANYPIANILTDFRTEVWKAASASAAVEWEAQELVTNGQFGSGISGWTDNSTGDGSFAWDTDHAELDANTGTAEMGQTISNLIKGKKYRLKLKISENCTGLTVTGGTSAYAGTEHFTKTYTSVGSKLISFEAAGTTLYLEFKNSTNEIVAIDEISLRDLDTAVKWGDDVAWGSTTGSLPKITLTMGYPSKAIGIANTNAEYIQVRVIGHDGTTEVQFTKNVLSKYTKDVFIEYPIQHNTHTIEIEFIAQNGVVPQCGVARAGPIYEFSNPAYGLSEGLIDHSIKKILNNGSTYYKKRGITRNFSGSILVNRDYSFYRFLYSLVQANGENPLMWQLTDVNAKEWAVFAAIAGMVRGNHAYYSHSQISFSLEERL